MPGKQVSWPPSRDAATCMFRCAHSPGRFPSLRRVWTSSMAGSSTRAFLSISGRCSWKSAYDSFGQEEPSTYWNVYEERVPAPPQAPCMPPTGTPWRGDASRHARRCQEHGPYAPFSLSTSLYGLRRQALSQLSNRRVCSTFPPGRLFMARSANRPMTFFNSLHLSAPITMRLFLLRPTKRFITRCNWSYLSRRFVGTGTSALSGAISRMHAYRDQSIAFTEGNHARTHTGSHVPFFPCRRMRNNANQSHAKKPTKHMTDQQREVSDSTRR